MTLCRILHEENGVFRMEDRKVRAHMARAWNRDGGLIGIIGEPGKPEGCIFLNLDTAWYSDEIFLEEMLNFVHPDHRRTTHAKELVSWAKRMADAIGVPLMIGIISNARTQEKIRLYRRQLGEPAGAFFLYRAVTGNVSQNAPAEVA